MLVMENDMPPEVPRVVSELVGVVCISVTVAVT